jgi:glycosyltransferase involved in cell wall biosynthesis
MNIKKNIIFIIGSLNIGGAEKVLINYANGFNKYYKDEYNIEVFLISKEGNLLKYLDNSIELNYLYLGNEFLSRNFIKRNCYKIYRKILSILFKNFPFFYRTFFNKYSNFEYGFILVQDLFYFSKSNFGKKKYLWIQNNLTNVDNNEIYNNLNIYTNFESIIANSKGIYEDLTNRLKIPASKVFLCYNPVDFNKTKDLANDYTSELIHLINNNSPYFVTLGRAVYQKGFDILIDAFEIISQINSKINLIIIGGGILENDLKEVVKSKNLENRIRFIGPLSNPYPIVAGSQFYVCSSRYEGLPTAMIEAMSLGKSVISTPCNFGPNEILEDGKYGVLCSSIDSKSLADSILKFLDSDNEFIKTMNSTSALRSQFFSTKSSIDNLLKILS